MKRLTCYLALVVLVVVAALAARPVPTTLSPYISWGSSAAPLCPRCSRRPSGGPVSIVAPDGRVIFIGCAVCLCELIESVAPASSASH